MYGRRDVSRIALILVQYSHEFLEFKNQAKSSAGKHQREIETCRRHWKPHSRYAVDNQAVCAAGLAAL